MTSANHNPVPGKAVLDRYRCPESVLDFQVDAEVSRTPGFFRFGSDATCFARSSSGGSNTPVEPLSDALVKASWSNGSVRLPFDPDEVIDNLRLERYSPAGWSAYDQALKSIYYSVRPLTTRSFRKRIQKLRALDWQKASFPRWPVDTSVESICENLLTLALRAKNAERIPFVWFWPEGASGCVAMTHDVEDQVGLDHCLDLLDLDDRFGIKASVQIVPEDRYRASSDLLSEIRSRGHEICVQDLNHDGRLFDDREEFRRRAVLINQYGREYDASGFRAAVLYRKPEWFEDLKFSFDMSIPNVARLDPQRGGCCTVMPYFIRDILEIPVTTIQDYMLFHLLDQRSIDLWKTQMDLILAKNGLASFIVHPDYILEPETLAVYQELLTWLHEVRRARKVWFALPREIDTWWRARHNMCVVKRGDSWQIEGEGADRATLAFAQLEDDKLAYRCVEGKSLTALSASIS